MTGTMNKFSSQVTTILETVVGESRILATKTHTTMIKVHERMTTGLRCSTSRVNLMRHSMMSDLDTLDELPLRMRWIR